MCIILEFSAQLSNMAAENNAGQSLALCSHKLPAIMFLETVMTWNLRNNSIIYNKIESEIPNTSAIVNTKIECQ